MIGPASGGTRAGVHLDAARPDRHGPPPILVWHRACDLSGAHRRPEPAMSSRVPAPCAPHLRARLMALLPPRATGLVALSDLAAALRALMGTGEASSADALALLAESWMASWPVLVRHLRVRVRALDPDQAEDVVGGLAADLGGLLARWHGEVPFASYVERALVYRGRAALRDRSASHARLDEIDLPEGAITPEPELSEAGPASVRVRALRRLTWYLYGSPDNPQRLRYGKSEADFQALATRLEGRPYADLVRFNQPRPGRWDEGEGEVDRKWWRGRATSAQRRLQQALASPLTRTLLDQITRAIQEDSP